MRYRSLLSAQTIGRLAVSIERSRPTMIPSAVRMTTMFIHPGLFNRSAPWTSTRAAEDFPPRGRKFRSPPVRRRAAIEQSEHDFAARLPPRDWRGVDPHPIRKALGASFVNDTGDPARLYPTGCPRLTDGRVDGANVEPC
jgi:hypothetical protein